MNFQYYCIVKGCKSISGGATNFFRFPKNSSLRKAWCNNLQIEDSDLIDSSVRVCDKHFALNSLDSKKLKLGSLPTINLGLGKGKKRKCSISGCSSNSAECMIYSFPSSTADREAWAKACNLQPENDLWICGKHFDPEVIGPRMLRSDAFPIIDLNSTQHSSGKEFIDIGTEKEICSSRKYFSDNFVPREVCKNPLSSDSYNNAQNPFDEVSTDTVESEEEPSCGNESPLLASKTRLNDRTALREEVDRLNIEMHDVEEGDKYKTCENCRKYSKLSNEYQERFRKLKKHMEKKRVARQKEIDALKDEIYDLKLKIADKNIFEVIYVKHD